MSDTRKPLDNLLDALRDCSVIVEQKIDGQDIGVFDVVFDRRKAKELLQDYISMLSVGRSG